MYTRYSKLSDESLAALDQLCTELEWKHSTSHRRRMGENGINALSEYDNTRWFTWTHEQRLRFRAAMPENQQKKALVGYYIQFAPVTGFLDRMTTWVDKPASSGTIIAYALQDNQVIYLNDEPVVVNRGEGIGFNLGTVHEVKASEQGQLWANMMVLGCHKAHAA